MANEIKMLAKLKYKVGDEIAEDIPKALELVKQKRREELLKKCEPIKPIRSVYGMGIYDARNEPISNKRIRWKDEIEDEDRAFWSKKPYY